MKNSVIFPIQNFKCPHCHALCAFNCAYSARGYFSGYWYPVSVWFCQSCVRALFIQGQRTSIEHDANSQFHIESKFPTIEPSAHKHIPTGIADDFIEATKDYNNGAFKSSAVMARRTIQKICLNLGAKKGAKLVDQISSLKEESKLHPDLAEIATEIRFLGNNGAHPEEDGLDEINNEDAKEIIDFTAELLDDLYVRPKKVAAMREKRMQKNTDTNA